MLIRASSANYLFTPNNFFLLFKFDLIFTHTQIYLLQAFSNLNDVAS
jgi:hypothetical protein